MDDFYSTSGTDSGGPIDLEDPENMIKEIICICSRLIFRYKMIVPQLGAIRDTLHKHKLAVDISRTLGAAATVAGTIMIFTPIAPVGIGLLVGGGATSVGAIVGDTVVSIVEAKKAAKIVERTSGDIEKLTKLLTILQDSCNELKNKTGANEKDACAIIVYAILSKGIKVDTNKAGADIARSVGRIVSIATDTAKLIGGKGVGLLDDVMIGIASKISASFGKTAAQVLPGVLQVAGRVLAVLGAVIDVGTMIYGWVSRNPTEQQVTTAINELEAATEKLEDMKNSFEEVCEEFDKNR